MDTVPGLSELHARKRELLLESELNRQVLRLEVEKVRYRAEQFRHGLISGQNIWRWVAPVAGFFIARKFKKTAGLFAKGSLLVSIASGLWKAWETSRGPRADSKI